MMKDILLHENTRTQIETILANPPHAILIIGPAGSGKKFIAKSIAAELQKVSRDYLEKQPYYIKIEKPKDKQEIPIDDIRQMIRKLSTKTAGRARVVLIEQAELMSTESQNALLKNIEEPVSSTFFIMTAPTISALLPTIISRSQKLNILPVSQVAATEYFGGKYSDQKIISAWNLSKGSSGLMHALLENDDMHPLKSAVEDAKDFLKMDSYQRAIFLDRLSADKAAYKLFLDALDRLIGALTLSAIKNGKTVQVKRAINSRKLVNEAINGLSVNTSPRLISLNLAQQLLV